MDATIARLQEELSRLRGPARVQVLVQLGQEYADRYWRAGPGVPTALGLLSEAIKVTEEAYELLTADDPFRPQVGALLGWWLHARYAAHGGAVADREAAIAVLSEALGYPDLPPVLVPMARIALGQLHLGRAVEPMTPAAARAGFLGGFSPSSRADADEAIRYLRAIVDGPPTNAEIVSVAETMLTMAEALQPLLGGDLAGFDLGKIMNAMTVLQQAQQRFRSDTGMGLPSPRSLGLQIGRMDPLDHPGANLSGDPEQVPAVPPRRPVATRTTPIDREAPRRTARNRLSAMVADPDKSVWEQALALLEAGPERLPAGDLDAYLGSAANAVAAGEDGDPVESGLDRLLSAVGLCLRERRDGIGWDEDTVGGGSLAAAELLLAASTRIPPGHPAAAVVVEALGGLLVETRPLSGPIAEVAEQLGDYAADIASPPAAVVAFGELCRVIAALTAGGDVDPEPLSAAIRGVPADHARREVLATAASQARFAAAVRAGGPVRDELAAGHLGPLLEAVLGNDVEALRTAVDSLVGTAPPPRVAAVIGAGYLELAIRAPIQGRHDLAAAIPLLSDSAEALEDTRDSLRTRTLWRLVEAYRRRGAPSDVESGRDAGLEALRGGDPEPRSAARFAGWMLANRHAEEAYTALEIAAAESGLPGSAVSPLAEDILTVILGITPRAARPAAPPPWTEVAAAVRKVGASALLYLHPTDEAGRTVGVLCLDPGTDRLDVLANVPVTDPLTSDDPAWSAILSRWSSGGLLVAATGDLRRVALPAVCTGAGRRLAQDVTVGYVSSGAQVVELAERVSVPVEKAPLFVVNPRGDRDPEMADVLALRRLFYPRSVCVGRALESVDGVGTRAVVLSRLPGASLVHLACRVRGRYLDLAGEDVLDVVSAHGGGLVILAESGTDGFGPAAEAFLGAGFSGVIGWQWQVPPSFAAVALFMTHLMLVDHRLPPVVAVASVQRWMLDPDRKLPPLLPNSHRHTVENIDLARPALWSALAYRGC